MSDCPLIIPTQIIVASIYHVATPEISGKGFFKGRQLLSGINYDANLKRDGI